MKYCTLEYWSKISPPKRRVPPVIYTHVLLVYTGFAWVSLIVLLPMLYSIYKITPAYFATQPPEDIIVVIAGYLLLGLLVVPWKGYPAIALLRNGTYAVADRISVRRDTCNGDRETTVTYRYITMSGMTVDFEKYYYTFYSLLRSSNREIPRKVAILYDCRRPKRVIILPGQLSGIQDALDVFRLGIDGNVKPVSYRAFTLLYMIAVLYCMIIVRVCILCYHVFIK